MDFFSLKKENQIPPSIEPENIPFKWFGFFAMQEIASICPSIAPINGLAKIYITQKKKRKLPIQKQRK